jgi:ribosomal protein S18 acetylase RimI-like enzyme
MIEIRQDRPSLELLTDYATVPISFDGHSHFEVQNEDGRWQLTEIHVPPFFKDYDTLEHPTDWASRFDMSQWMMFSAFDDDRRVGGAIVAIRTPGVDMLEGRSDLAVLWDIRVDPDHRSRGLGESLFHEVIKWSRAQGCGELKIETQQVNVAACKFYTKMGCELRVVNKGHYPGQPDENQLLWYRNLK